MRCKYLERPSIQEIQLASETTKILWSQWHRFVVKDGVVYRTLYSKSGEPSRLQFLTPKSLRNDVIKQSHGGMTGGHLGIYKTCDQVQRRAFWIGWRNDVVRFCRRCTNCNTYHRGVLPRNASLQPILAGAPFERVSIDLTGPHVRTPRGSVYILTCIDVFTKWTEAFPLPNKEAAVVARVLVEQVFCRFGVPIALLSDNGTEVDSTIMREICKILDIDKLHTTAYKASTNAVIERWHKTLNSMIGKVVSEKQNDWDLWLPYIMAAYRSSRHDSTGYTPNYLTLSRENRAPIDLVLGTSELREVKEETYDDFVETTRDRMSSAYDLVRRHVGEAAVRNKRYYDMRVKPRQFQKGDWVYYFNPRKFQGRQDKWSRKYTGPFCVINVPGPVNVELQLNKRSKPFIVHIDKVKHFHGEPPKAWLDIPIVEETVVTENCEDIYDENLVKTKTGGLTVVVNDTATNSNSVTNQPDVVTFDLNQELRRNRPRRQPRLPSRFLD